MIYRNTRYRKIAADWCRKNLKKPTKEDFDILDRDFFLIHMDGEATVWRALIYREVYEIKFMPFASPEGIMHTRMTVTRLDNVTEEIVKVSV